MGNHVLEYVIKLTDKVSVVAESVANGVKKMAAKVSGAMNDTARAVESGNKRVEEKFIHTENVLDKMWLAYERLGVKGKDFADAMDVLERRLDNFNKTGQGQEELFKHLKLSMEDFGASEKQVAAGLEMLKANLVETNREVEKGADVGAALGKGFIQAHLAAGILNGNVYSLSRGLAMVANGFKAVNVSAGLLTAVGAIVMLVVSGVQKLIKSLKEQEERMERIKQKKFEEAYDKIAKAQQNLREEMSKTMSAMDEELRHQDAMLQKSKEILKTQIEIERSKRLALAKSDDEREDINTEYNRKSALVDEVAEDKVLQLELDNRRRKLALIEEQQRKNTDALAEYGKTAAQVQADMEERERIASNKARWTSELKYNSMGQPYMAPRLATPDEQARKTQELLDDDDTYQKYKANAEKIRDKMEETKKEIESLGSRALAAQNKIAETQAAQTLAAAKKEARAEKEKADAAKREELRQKKADKEEEKQEKLDAREARKLEKEAQRAQKAAEREAERYQKMLDKEYNAQVKMEEKAAREVARIKKREAKELHDEAVRLAREEVRERERIEREAQVQLAAARRKVAEAWGFYKDKDKLKKHDAEVDADVAAGDQYEKDYHSLTHGVNSGRYAHLKYLADHRGDDAVEAQLSEWRRKKTISVDSEATMRVALANREQAAAQDYAKQTAEATTEARDYLESINDALTSGGEE